MSLMVADNLFNSRQSSPKVAYSWVTMTYPLVVLLLTGNYDNQTAMSIGPHLRRVGAEHNNDILFLD
jgi:hypothetical protein